MKSDHKASNNRIIIIDDNVAIHDDFKKILVKEGDDNRDLEDLESLLFGSAIPGNTGIQFEIDCALQGKEGWEMVKNARENEKPYALAFVDGRMPPGWDGIETIKHLWEISPELQIVLCTAYADYSWKEIQDVLGKSDSLLILKKPFDNVEVLQLTHALTRKWELNQEIQGRLHHLAYYDNLTGLPNRALFVDRLTLALEAAQRDKYKGALLFIDLDNFKRINDTLGHSVGDELLRIMAQRILLSLRNTDKVSRPIIPETAARLGGDEFTIVIPELYGNERAAVVARRIEKQLAEPVHLGNHEFIITSSIGIAIFPDDGNDVESLLKNADLAMYFSKNSGQGRFNYYRESMNEAALRRLTIENHLRIAIEHKELELYYQPQVNITNNKITGFEALLRWHNEDLGTLSPLEFIPVAEESGLILSLGDWVIRTACKQAKAWFDKGYHFERIAVNVSVRQFTHPDFAEKVLAIVEEFDLTPNTLEIEITESLLMQDFEKLVKNLENLRKHGIQISVDDFGTGYSSLSRLKEIPIDSLKIDRTFIVGIEKDGRDLSIIEAIIAMAKGMHLRVIAEGVETSKQLNYLLNKQCYEAQGYLYSRPEPAEQIEQFLQQGAFLKPALN